MTERKSDFTGDRFGDWVVTGRAKAEDKKRRWQITNTQTDEQKVVFQTDLAGLAKFQGKDPGLPHPFDITGPELYRLQAMEGGFRVNDVGQRIHGADDPIRYEPQGVNALSAQIAREVMGGNLAGQLMLDEAFASVALDNDPEIGTYSLEPEVPHPVRSALVDAMTALADARDAIDRAFKVAMTLGV